ncbi:ABC transporter permease (plasmid) [Paroceanicella profunda]|uniref:ABC transporter permease n=1 Tax=Paroceanicella profunda TaxID=2579971 RepID=A0A5B8FY23_9RHOB|nr:ABC transporter permease [Paroceanicella profunda]QDL93816.1 ABC transporter permease [Paroceanicella profunda]
MKGRLLTGGYLLLFFAYLFGPLVIMIGTAFNSAGFPRLAPWECFTTEWFSRLAADDRLLTGLGNSLLIGLGVVLVSTPIGLAAALMLSQVGARMRAALYTIFIAPILVPGVVIGLSTLIFWDRVGGALDAGYNTLFYDGFFLTILGQVTFISAYSMLVFLSRLQRFDPTLTEAALDMGATPTQAFVKILLPFVAPAIGSAAVLAFLASMENYNTTVFTVVSESTFTTVLASKVRYGIDPSISAIAVIIVAITLIAALTYEAAQQRTSLAGRIAGHPVLRRLIHPAPVALLLLVLAGAVVWAGSRVDSSACEAQVLEEKRALQEQYRTAPEPQSQPSAPASPTAPRDGAAPASPFSPGNLAPGSGTGGGEAPSPAAPASPFAPGNLAPGGSGESGTPASPFAPGNLAPGSGG